MTTKIKSIECSVCAAFCDLICKAKFNSLIHIVNKMNVQEKDYDNI